MDSLTYLIVPATLGLLYTVGLVIYRLVFHPLARVPGPKLAAATQWYEGWYDLFVGTGGTYWKEIDRMHEKYGKTRELKFPLTMSSQIHRSNCANQPP